MVRCISLAVKLYLKNSWNLKFIVRPLQWKQFVTTVDMRMMHEHWTAGRALSERICDMNIAKVIFNYSIPVFDIFIKIYKCISLRCSSKMLRILREQTKNIQTRSINRKYLVIYSALKKKNKNQKAPKVADAIATLLRKPFPESPSMKWIAIYIHVLPTSPCWINPMMRSFLWERQPFPWWASNMTQRQDSG